MKRFILNMPKSWREAILTEQCNTFCVFVLMFGRLHLAHVGVWV